MTCRLIDLRLQSIANTGQRVSIWVAGIDGQRQEYTYALYFNLYVSKSHKTKKPIESWA